MRKNTTQLNTSKLRRCLALFIFLITVGSSYSLFYMLRESVRYFSITYDYDIWLLSDHEVWFYNTCYAMIALILGLSAAINFLIDRPAQFSQRQARSTRASIVIDVRLLTWSFLSWSIKLGFGVAILLICIQGYSDFSLYPKYAYVFILFIIVLYLQLWLHISRFFRKTWWKYAILMSPVYVLISFILGSINLVDYKGINANVLKNNVYYNYEIIKPKSSTWSYNRRSSASEDLYITSGKLDSSEPVYIFDIHQFEIQKLDTLAQSWLQSYPVNHRANLLIQLNIDQDIEMVIVNDVICKLVRNGISKFGYAITPIGDSNTKRRNKHSILEARHMNYDTYPDLLDNSQAYSDEFVVKFGIDEATLNDNDFSQTALLAGLGSIDEEISIVRIQLHYDDEVRYKRFIEVYSEIIESINILRDEHALSKYGKKYRSCTWNERKHIRLSHSIILEDINYQSRFLQNN